MNTTTNAIFTALIAAAGAIAASVPQWAVYAGAVAAVLKVVDGILTHQAVKS